MTIDEIKAAMGPIYTSWMAKDADDAKKNRDRHERALKLLSFPATGERITFTRAKNKWPSREDALKGFL